MHRQVHIPEDHPAGRTEPLLQHGCRDTTSSGVEVKGTFFESLASICAALHIMVTESVVWPRDEDILETNNYALMGAATMRNMRYIPEAYTALIR